jgi:hypothetical protein
VEQLGPFDLDPCSPIIRPWNTAKYHLTKEDDGLACDWFGCVWMNPPYGPDAKRWLARLAGHNNGIALVFARTETTAFHDFVWPRASAVFFPKGRIQFVNAQGMTCRECPAPSIFIAYGQQCADRLRRLTMPGKFISLAEQP